MKFYVAKIDETQFISDEALPEIGTYYGYYLYTEDESTNCCELVPSFWLEACGFETEHYDEDIEEELRRYLHESSHYRHCKDANKLSKEFFGDFDSLEDALDHFQANPRYF
jgi:hypothetical protein